MSGRGNGKISSSAALIRTAVNSDCDLVAATALEQVSELDTFKCLMNKDYEGEYGIRPSLVRRGAKFENNNHANDAMALRKRVAELLGRTGPEDVLVRDLDKEEPVTGGDVHGGNLRRYRKTQNIVREAYRQKPDTPDLVIHPTFELPLLKGTNGQLLIRGSRYLNPDFMVLERDLGIFLIGDEKSFIVRDDTIVEAAKLDQVRRQIASGTLAMRHELRGIDFNAPIISEGLLVFATPYGLSAAAIVREDLSGEIQQIEKAIPQLQRVAQLLAELRTQGYHQFSAIAPTLGTNLKESCYGRCLMTEYCEGRVANIDATLGRDVKKLLAGKTASEIAALAANRNMLQPRDAALLANIEQAAIVLGLDLATYLQEVA
jgi:hypothetical protein